MIETNYQMTCDACEAKAEEPTIVHSLIECGDVMLTTFWKYLRAAGWRRLNSVDHCPKCVAVYDESRKEEIEANYRKRKKRGKLTEYERFQAGKLSKTAREAFKAHVIDNDDGDTRGIVFADDPDA